MRARLAVLAVLALAGSWATAAPAAALGPGVHVDPGSPAGKEYTPPLSALRGQANGKPAAPGKPQPPFGIGITPARGGAGNSTAALAGGGGAAGGAAAHRGARTRALSGGPGGAGGAGQNGANSAGQGGASGVGTQATGTGAGSGSHLTGAAATRLAATGSAFPSVALLAAVVLLGGLVLGSVLALARRRSE